MLSDLARDSTLEIQATVAGHTSTPSPALTLLAGTAHARVAGRVARNPNTTTETLTRLVDNWAVVRTAVAAHPNVDPKLLWQLGGDGATRAVRAAVAKSGRADHATFMRAAQDRDSWVRRMAASNPKATVEALVLLAADLDDGVRANAAKNPNTDAETLETLSTDQNDRVRKAVAHNRSAEAADRVMAALL